MRRMTVHNSVNIRSSSIDQLVHRKLRRNTITGSFKRSAVLVYDDHHLGFHPAFADSGGCRDYAIGTYPYNYIPITGHDESAVVTKPRKVDDLLPDFCFVNRHC